MFVLANFFEALGMVVGYAIDILWWLIIIRALLSWVSPDPMNPVVQFIERMTDPLLAPFRHWVPSHRIGVDVSPLFALLLLYFLKVFIVKTLIGISFRLR